MNYLHRTLAMNKPKKNLPRARLEASPGTTRDSCLKRTVKPTGVSHIPLPSLTREGTPYASGSHRPTAYTQPAFGSYCTAQLDSALSPASQSLPSTIPNHREGYGTQSHTGQDVDSYMDTQEAGNWRDKCQALDLENNKLRGVVETLKKRAGAQRKRADAEATKCQREKEMLEEVRLSHIRAVNSTSTGLDPIADQTFVEKYPMLHRDVCAASLTKKNPLQLC